MRIAVVSERRGAAHALQSAVDMEPGHRVAWTAASGAEAVERCCDDRPDLVLLDLLGAGLDTSETARRIMERTPCAILLVTDSVRANTARVFDAMVWGAVDAVDFPSMDGGNAAGTAPLLAKIAMIGKLIGAAPTKDATAVTRGARASASATPLIA